MSTSKVHVVFFGISDPGLVRANNEDHFIVADLTRKIIGVHDNNVSTELLAHQVGVNGTLFAVADGLGGYEHGEIASHIAVEAIVYALFDIIDTYDSPTEWLLEAVDQAHLAICQHIENAEDNVRMGSTLTAIHVGDGVMTIAQVGDSRAYRLRNSEFTTLTEDQTLINMLRARGQITAEEAENHPGRHIILQALGQEKPVYPDISRHTFEDGDYLLLCSDGLSSYVADETIQAILLEEGDEPSHCKRLIEAAYAEGGPDNITVLLARLSKESPSGLDLAEVNTPDDATRHPFKQ
jgi:protein phosphatase